MGNTGGKSIEEQIFDLKFASKSFERDGSRCHKAELKAKTNVKKALAEGRREFAEIHAADAIRERRQALIYLQMAARVDGAVSRLTSAAIHSQVLKEFSTVSNAVNEALKSQNMKALGAALDQWDSQALDSITIPGQQQQLAKIDMDGEAQILLDQLSLELLQQLPAAPSSAVALPEADDLHLQKRLDNLL